MMLRETEGLSFKLNSQQVFPIYFHSSNAFFQACAHFLKQATTAVSNNKNNHNKKNNNKILVTKRRRKKNKNKNNHDHNDHNKDQSRVPTTNLHNNIHSSPFFSNAIN